MHSSWQNELLPVRTGASSAVKVQYLITSILRYEVYTTTRYHTSARTAIHPTVKRKTHGVNPH